MGLWELTPIKGILWWNTVAERSLESAKKYYTNIARLEFITVRGGNVLWPSRVTTSVDLHRNPLITSAFVESNRLSTEAFETDWENPPKPVRMREHRERCGVPPEQQVEIDPTPIWQQVPGEDCCIEVIEELMNSICAESFNSIDEATKNTIVSRVSGKFDFTSFLWCLWWM